MVTDTDRILQQYQELARAADVANTALYAFRQKHDTVLRAAAKRDRERFYAAQAARHAGPLFVEYHHGSV